MTQAQWTAVDQYFTDRLIPADDTLDAALAATEQAGMPAQNVAPNQGAFLQVMAMSVRAQRILEVGTLGGYSTIWLARGLVNGGHIVTLEAQERHAEVARQNIVRAGFGEQVTVRVGQALDSLAGLKSEGHPPFDLVFIDADKENNTGYFEYALELTQPGSMIIVDNVVRKGAVINADDTDSRVQGVRRFIERVADEPRVTVTALQTVGSKGYDGFAVMIVKE